MNKFIYYFAFLILLITTYSCVEDDDFEVPDTSQVIVDAPEGLIDIQAIVNQYNTTFAGRPQVPIKFEEGAGFIEGFVISSDEGGNFFKELIIQDKSENPTIGLNIKIDVSPLFTRFEFGRRVYIKLEGLSLGEASGVYALGVGNDLDAIPTSIVDRFILRDEETLPIIPKEIALSQVNQNQLNQWVRVINVQFQDSELNKTFASELGDTFDGNRLLRTCENFFSVPLIYQTSTFADFKALRIPTGGGSVDAIVSKDFTGTNFVLNSNSPENFNFDSATRCMFDVVSCESASAPGSNILLRENFSTGINNRATTPAGWVNYIENGTIFWQNYLDPFTNSRATRANTFGSGNENSVAWLITPRINFESQTGEVLEFFTSTEFVDDARLEILFSNNWDGTAAGVPRADWLPIAGARIAGKNDPANRFYSSGNVSLDCVTGLGAIAFKYVGSELVGGRTSNTNGTFELDDVTISSN